MSSLSGHKLNLKQAMEIKANQYRSSDNRRDYQPEEIDERILELQANKDEKALRALMAKTNGAVIAFDASNFKKAKKELKRVKTVETIELVTEIHEFWKITKSNGGFELLAIPPQIMEF